MPEFIPGLTLAKRFYVDAVQPILDRSVPGLPFSAGLIGDGSEVLGFDTEVSADHDWGPRVMVFLDPVDHARHAPSIVEVLRRSLPSSFLGWSTSFSQPDPADNGTQVLEASRAGDVSHRVEVLTVAGFLRSHLGIHHSDTITARTWLTLPSQKLLSLTAGAMFRDDIGVEEIRRQFSWYPHDVWLYLMAAQWIRIGQEEHLMGRAGQVGDEIGASVIAARLVRDLMRLCFLVERRYAPYPKWLGTAFQRLAMGPSLAPLLWSVLKAESWQGRDRAWARAAEAAADLHNALEVTEPLAHEARPFFSRPFSVIAGSRFAAALRSRIEDPEVKGIPHAIGAVDQWSDSTDLLENSDLRLRLESLYLDGEGT